MIEARQLRFVYGEFVAVEQLSFKAKPGEVVGLLGPNGAGKTTTMRMLTGYLPPSAGTAIIDRFDIRDESFEARRRIGYLPERVPVYPDMTVRGYVLFWARMRHVRHPHTSTDQILRRFDLYSRRHKLIRHLSKGLRQRLGLAQALVHDPAVVILDEPTIGIDPQQVIDVRSAIRDIGRERTVVLSTHVLKEAEEMCQRVLIINHGRLVAQGTPEELRRQVARVHYFVQIGGASPKQQREFLTRLPGVQDVQADGSGFTLTSGSTDDLRPVLSSQIVARGWTLLELRIVQSSLEDIFLQAVSDPTEARS
jgi:ABC-2 type transport system ATP-binding protein